MTSEAVTLIDSHLSPTNDRTMYSAEEVQNLLLDLRNLIEASEAVAETTLAA